MVRKVTKYANRVMDARQIRYELGKAHHLATTGRPGPVWVDVPMNIQAAPVESEGLPEFDPSELAPSCPSLRLIQDPEKAAHDVWRKLSGAQRPVIWLGHGIRLAEATDLIGPLLDHVPAPALVSWAGIDMVDSDHPRVFGRAGVYGQRCANFVLQNCDFLLTIGTRLAVPQVGYDLSEFARAAEIAVVDIDADEAVKHGDRITLPICMDARVFLSALIDRRASRSRWRSRLGWSNAHAIANSTRGSARSTRTKAASSTRTPSCSGSNPTSSRIRSS